MREVALKLVETLKRVPPRDEVDIDIAMQCEAFDVIGKAGHSPFEFSGL